MTLVETGPVPFLDLGPSHDLVREDVLDDVRALTFSGAFTNGPQVAAFERAFAEYTGASYCVGVASGLDALRLALRVLGIGPGDEVIVPALTFVATFEAVSQVGATPVPADIGASDFCLDPAAIEAALTTRTRALMPVHLYGRLADMGRIAPLAAGRGLDVVEDACQAHGASRDGNRAGTSGTAAAFSFYPGKNLGAMGDAGALVTDDESIAEAVRALREHGQRRKYEHDEIGWTARLDTIQAAVLLRKLAYLDDWNDQRRAVADLYADGLAGVGDLAASRRGRPDAGLAPLCGANRRPGRARRLPRGALDRDRASLPGAAASLACLPRARVRGRLLPGRRAGGA